MVNFKMKKFLLAASSTSVLVSPAAGIPFFASAVKSAVKAEREVDAAYAKATGRPYNGTSDTDAPVLPLVLNQLGIGRWAAQWVPATDLAAKVLTYLKGPLSPPVIVLLNWGTTGDGHFVVCDNLVQHGSTAEAEICDPWDGAVRSAPLVPGQAIAYVGADQGTSLDFGQQHFKYPSPSSGSLNGWIISKVG